MARRRKTQLVLYETKALCHSVSRTLFPEDPRSRDIHKVIDGANSWDVEIKHLIILHTFPAWGQICVFAWPTTVCMDWVHRFAHRSPSMHDGKLPGISVEYSFSFEVQQAASTADNDPRWGE